MLAPCVHLLAVVGKATPQMFHPRWHTNFQLFYGRQGNERLTKAFDEILRKEFRGICVEGQLCQQESFPYLHEGTTTEDFEKMTQILSHFGPWMLGEPFQNGEASDDGFAFEDDDDNVILSDEKGDELLSIRLHQSPMAMKLTQASQAATVYTICNFENGFYSRMMATFKSFVRDFQDTAQGQRIMEEQLKKAQETAYQLLGELSSAKRKEPQTGPFVSLTMGNVTVDKDRKSKRMRY